MEPDAIAPTMPAPPKVLTALDYWQAIAPYYDSLYDDPYSLLENSWVYAVLHQLFAQRTGVILDAGCGTGLGRALLPRRLGYEGIDLAPAMITQAQAAYPNHSFRVGDIERLPYEDAQFDGVISLFSVFSFVSDPQRAAAEVLRVIKPGAPFLIMALNQFALWRWLWPSPQGVYRTRHDGLSVATPAHFYSPRRLRGLFQHGARVDYLGVSWFGRVYENARYWSLDKRLCRWLPGVAFNGVLVGVKHE